MTNNQRFITERRNYERHEYAGHVVLGHPGKGAVLAGTIINLSIGGCLMKLRAPCDLKPEAVVEVAINCGVLAFCTLGHIKRHETDDCLIGIEFLNLGLEGRRNLRELITGFKSQQPHQPEMPKDWSYQCFCNPNVLSPAPETVK